MELNIITLMKALIGGAGSGFAISGGLSMIIPTFTVTTGVAYLFAITGGLAMAGTYILKKMSSGSAD
ncbi:TPA: hypothetical protein ACYZ3U_000635 [Escherichia coli]